MKLYLIQHGDSVEKEIDPERPLSEQGKKDIEYLAHFLSHLDLTVKHIYHSGKKRAEQTAEILAYHLFPDVVIEAHSDLDPMDPVEPFARSIAQVNEDTLVAGHLPFMARLVGKLLVQDENNILVDYKPGSIVCLERYNNKYVIQWMLRPELVASE